MTALAATVLAQGTGLVLVAVAILSAVLLLCAVATANVCESGYDEIDILKTARAFPLWRDGERYAIPITSEAVTLFINGDALAARASQ